MATNELLTTDLIAKGFLAELINNTPFLMTGSREWQDQFTDTGYAIGDTINLQKQNFFEIGDGESATPQAIKDRSVPLEIKHQYNAMISYTAKDLTLNIIDFRSKIIKPVIRNMKAKIENDIAQSFATSSYDFVGTAGSALNSWISIDRAGTKLFQKNVNLDDDSYCAVTLNDASTLKSNLLSNFTDSINTEIVKSSRLGHLSYFDLFQSQSIYKHTAGNGPVNNSGDSLTVNGAVSSGNTIILAGATSGVSQYFKAGDLISIAGVNSVYPVGNEDTGDNKQFVITADADSDGGGAVTIQVSPSINSTGGDPLRNVTNAVPNNAVVTVHGSHNKNIAYVPDGLVIAAPPLAKLDTTYWEQINDESTGLSVSVTRDANIYNYQNNMRFDILMGFAPIPEYNVVIMS